MDEEYLAPRVLWEMYLKEVDAFIKEYKFWEEKDAVLDQEEGQ